MKLQNYRVLFVLCLISIQFVTIKCADGDDDNSDSANVDDTGSSDDDTPSDTNDDSSDNADTTNDSGGDDDSGASDDTGTDNSDDNSDDTASDTTDDNSDDTASDTTDGGDDTSSDADSDTADDDDNAEEEDDTEDPPATGTVLNFDLNTAAAGTGLTAEIYFTQMDNGVEMSCTVSVTEGTAAANFWPDEFSSDDDDDSGSDDSSDDSDDSGSDTTDDDATVLSDSGDTDEAETNDDAAETTNDAAETNDDAAETTNDAAETTDTDDSADDGNTDTDEAESNGSDDSSDDNSNSENTDDSSDDSDASDDSGSDDTTNDAADRSSDSCGASMPHVYALKSTTCCSDPSLAECASVEGIELGCIDKTGTDTHTFTDVTYYDFEDSCLAIADKQVSSGRRLPRFIPSTSTLTRAGFSLLNFNSVNFLSAGTKTVTSSASTGSVSINFAASSPSYSGSYNPGIFDNLPYISLPGLTADYINVVIVLVLIAYTLSFFLPLLNLDPLLNQLSAPFSRVGDFVSEKVDVLENRVKASVRNYNRKYYNNVRRVDYDLNYEYDNDDDYYYYVK